MAPQVIVDTDILIDFSLDKLEAVQTMAMLEQEYELSVSVITAMELYVGGRSKDELMIIDELLGGFSLFHVTSMMSEVAYKWMREFRPSHGVEINDLLVASTSLVMDVQLITKNQKHYRFLPGLNLMKYPISIQ